MRRILSVTLDSFQESLCDLFGVITFAESNLSFLVVDEHIESDIVGCELGLLPWRLRRWDSWSKSILFWGISDSSFIFGDNSAWVDDVLSQWFIAEEIMSIVELSLLELMLRILRNYVRILRDVGSSFERRSNLLHVVSL